MNILVSSDCWLASGMLMPQVGVDLKIECYCLMSLLTCQWNISALSQRWFVNTISLTYHWIITALSQRYFFVTILLPQFTTDLPMKYVLFRQCWLAINLNVNRLGLHSYTRTCPLKKPRCPNDDLVVPSDLHRHSDLSVRVVVEMLTVLPVLSS